MLRCTARNACMSQSYAAGVHLGYIWLDLPAHGLFRAVYQMCQLPRMPELPSCVFSSAGTILHGGPLSIPVDGPLMVMAGFSIVNMVQHLIVVPLVHRYRMKPSIAVITFLFYVCFNVLYVLATVGVIHIETINPV